MELTATDVGERDHVLVLNGVPKDEDTPPLFEVTNVIFFHHLNNPWYTVRHRQRAMGWDSVAVIAHPFAGDSLK